MAFEMMVNVNQGTLAAMVMAPFVHFTDDVFGKDDARGNGGNVIAH